MPVVVSTHASPSLVPTHNLSSVLADIASILADGNPVTSPSNVPRYGLYLYNPRSVPTQRLPSWSM